MPPAAAAAALAPPPKPLPHLCQVAHAQVRVLQQHPAALGGGGGHVAPRNDFLPLPHGHAQGADLLALGQVLNQLGGVGACGWGMGWTEQGKASAALLNSWPEHAKQRPLIPSTGWHCYAGCRSAALCTPSPSPPCPPGDSRQMSGVRGRLSVQARSRLRGTLSVKRWPIAEAT